MLRAPRRSAGRPWRLPGAVARELERCRDELLARIGAAPADRLVDLVTASAPPGPTPGPCRAPDERPAGNGPTVLSFLQLSAAADPELLLSRGRAALAGGGRLVLVEPYRRTRLAGRLADVAAPLLRRATGLRVNLPVPAMVRRAGFTIASVERVTMPTAIVPLRSYCLIVAYVARVAAPGAAVPVPGPPDRLPNDDPAGVR